MELSIVASMYCSSAYIDEFLDRISKAANQFTDSYEIILVDDCSPDDSLDIAKHLVKDFHNLKIVELSKNHGHHRAMMIGLDHSCGDFVFLTDIDLEEAPENLSIFWEMHEKNHEVDVFYGLQTEKDTTFIRKHLSNSFYSFFNSLSSIKISNRELVSRLMNRNFVNNLLSYGEHSIFLPAIWTDAGFNQRSIHVSKTFDGVSTYSIIKRISLAVDALTSFSAKPLVYVFYSGLSISMLSILAILCLLLQKYFIGTPLLGWTSLIATIFLMGGLILFSLGIIGIYISKIYLEVKSRPTSIVRAIHSRSTQETETKQR